MLVPCALFTFMNSTWSIWKLHDYVYCCCCVAQSIKCRRSMPYSTSLMACVKRQQRSKHLPQAFTRREDSSYSVRRTRTCCASVRLGGPATVSCRHCVQCFLSSKTSEELEFAFSSRESKACSTCVSFRFFAVFVVLERQGGCRKTGLLLRPLSLPSAMRQRSWPRSVGDKGNLSDLDGSGTAVASGMLLGDTVPAGGTVVCCCGVLGANGIWGVGGLLLIKGEDIATGCILLLHSNELQNYC